MKRLHIVLSVSARVRALGMVLVSGSRSGCGGRPRSQGLGGKPRGARAAQAALEANYPENGDYRSIPSSEHPHCDNGPNSRVAQNSKGHILSTYSRSQNQGVARGGRAAMLWEFDENAKFVKEWGPALQLR